MVSAPRPPEMLQLPPSTVDTTSLVRGHGQRLFIVSDEAGLQQLIGGLHRMLQLAGCDAMDVARIVTAASELAQNILRYAGSGQVRICVGVARSSERDGPLHAAMERPCCEVTALDRGPGVVDVALALRDHYSTGGGLGLGLPGVRRLMDDFDLQSSPGCGTLVVVRRWLSR